MSTPLAPVTSADCADLLAKADEALFDVSGELRHIAKDLIEDGFSVTAGALSMHADAVKKSANVFRDEIERKDARIAKLEEAGAAEPVTLSYKLGQQIVAALEFYQNAWFYKTLKPPRYGFEWRPQEELLDDCGNAAKEALAALAKSPEGAELLSFTQRFDQLEKLLRPFAVAAEELPDGFPDDGSIWETPAAGTIDAKHLRAAREALSARAAVHAREVGE